MHVLNVRKNKSLTCMGTQEGESFCAQISANSLGATMFKPKKFFASGCVLQDWAAIPQRCRSISFSIDQQEAETPDCGPTRPNKPHSSEDATQNSAQLPLRCSAVQTWRPSKVKYMQPADSPASFKKSSISQPQDTRRFLWASSPSSTRFASD